MNRSDLQHQIDSRRKWIDSLREGLPYADGMAATQDRDRIRAYETEIKALEAKIAALPQEVSDVQDSSQMPLL